VREEQQSSAMLEDLLENKENDTFANLCSQVRGYPILGLALPVGYFSFPRARLSSAVGRR
jgi:hypothetical protein